MVKESHEKISLVCFGRFNDSKPFEKLELNFIPVGRIYNPHLLSFIYSISDMFIFPSFHETFGLVQAESMACGTPVIAYDNGGSQEALKGFEQNLVKKGNYQALAQKIIEKLEEPNLKSKKKMEERRNYVKENFSNKVQAKKYLEIFKELNVRKQ
jgi:glycosyltransferase involved in cell wall biosynthesis